MIRREVTLPGGGLGWLLVSQIEHARLAGALAAEWGAPPYSAVEPRDELLPAIVRHDDGWSEWERWPALDPATGRPRNFLEMPVEDSLLIWRTSIERAEAMSPLGGATVAGHFLHLLRHGLVWEQHGTRAAAAAHQWGAEFDALRQGWLDEWSASPIVPGSARGSLLETAAAAVSWLQFFDRLSLWFCMKEQQEPAELSTCGGPPLRLAPQARSTTECHDGDVLTVKLEPWPLRIPEFEITLGARLVPARRYADAAELAAVPWRLMRWRLRLVPE